METNHGRITTRIPRKALTSDRGGQRWQSPFRRDGRQWPPPKNIAGPSAGTTTAIEIREQRLHVETRTLTAVLDKGAITSLKSKITGEDFVAGRKPDAAPFRQPLYSRGETVADEEIPATAYSMPKTVDSTRREVVFHGWDADGVLAVSVDPESGDLIVEPSAYSSRPGA